MARTELIHFATSDRVPLAGLLYEPRRRAKGVLLWLHGISGSIFDSKRTPILGELFAKERYAFFPFNNRGAHLIRRPGLGSAYEVLRDTVRDIDAAIREMRRRGYRDVTLVGHSTGANKIAVYNHYKPHNPVTRYVLLGGGDDTGMLYRELGARKFKSYLAHKRTNDLMPGRIMTWRAFHDMANPNGDYNVFQYEAATRPRRPFRYIREIRKPSLYVYGANDEYGFDAALLAQNIGPKSEIVVIADADHGFHGHERELADVIVRWIDSEG